MRIIEGCKILQLSFHEKTDLYSLFLQNCRFGDKNIEIQSDKPDLPFPVVDRQALSNLRNWAEGRPDGLTAHIARGAELAVETHEEKGFMKPVLCLWRIFGNYGLSPLRSIAWLVGLWLLMAGALLYTGTELGQSTSGGAEVGWRASLAGEDWGAQISRAVVAASNNAINPFSVFSVRILVVPKDSFVAILMPIHGLISVGLILLTGFSLRRRLKLV